MKLSVLSEIHMLSGMIQPCFLWLAECFVVIDLGSITVF